MRDGFRHMVDEQSDSQTGRQASSGELIMHKRQISISKRASKQATKASKHAHNKFHQGFYMLSYN